MPRISAQPARISAEREPLPSVPTLCERRYSQSLERGLAILACFSPERPVWGIAELADELGMSRSTTHRYVITLVRQGYMVQAERRKYRLSLQVTDLGMAAMNTTSIQEHARPHLEDLHRRTGFTVVVAVLDGPEVLLVDRLRGSRRGQQQIDLDQAPGLRIPAHCTATGKLLLAHLPKRVQKHVIPEMRLTRRTPSTVISKNRLQAELRSICEQNLATSNEELAPGLYSIAAAVRSDSRETVAAIGMDAHSSMVLLADLEDALGPHLISAADRISARLGFRRADEQAAGR